MTDDKYIEGSPLPETVGAMADLLHEVRQIRLAIQNKCAPFAARESELKKAIIDQLDATDETGAAGQSYRAQITVKTKPTVQDWEALYDYIAENDRFDLLGRSVATRAVKEMWDNDEQVPGVGKVNVKDVSITKI